MKDDEEYRNQINTEHDALIEVVTDILVNSADYQVNFRKT